MCMDRRGTAHVRYGMSALHQRLFTAHVILEDAVHYLSYNCRRWNMRIPCNYFIAFNKNMQMKVKRDKHLFDIEFLHYFVAFIFITAFYFNFIKLYVC